MIRLLPGGTVGESMMTARCIKQDSVSPSIIRLRILIIEDTFPYSHSTCALVCESDPFAHPRPSFPAPPSSSTSLYPHSSYESVGAAPAHSES